MTKSNKNIKLGMDGKSRLRRILEIRQNTFYLTLITGQFLEKGRENVWKLSVKNGLNQ